MARIIQSRIATPGPIGPLGPTGTTGPAGPTGPTGPTGPQGTVALAGNGVATTAARSDHNHDTTFALKADKAWAANGLTTSDTPTTSATPVNIPSLSFAIGANEQWIVDFVIGTGCNGTGGVTFQAAAPAGCFVSLAGLGSGSSQSALIVNYTATGISPAFNTGVFYNGTVRLSCAFRNGATAGTVQLKVGAGTAGQTATAYTNSSMNARRSA